MKWLGTVIQILVDIAILFTAAGNISMAIKYFKQQRWYLFGVEVIVAILLIHNLLT